ncbi:MAG: KAP family NTPase [Agarilytica sp.]
MNNKNESKNWEDCKLNRNAQARLLTNYLLNRHSSMTARKEKDGDLTNTFALNIDASWGMGKTFFIERWSKDLKDNGYVTVSFNAWEHDYSKDAMASLLSSICRGLKNELKRQGIVDLEDSGVKKILSNLWESSSNITKKVAPYVLNIITRSTAGTEISEALVDDPESKEEISGIKNILGKLAEEAAKESFNVRDKSTNHLREFHNSVNAIVELIKKYKDPKLPVFIFIDELDRCRPDFSIEVIECVKHILNIDDLYFIFTTDSQQLNHSLKAVYGPDFEGEWYFKKIFDRECRLEEPHYENFSAYLFSEEAGHIAVPEGDSILLPFKTNGDIRSGLSKIFEVLSLAYKLDLRVQIASIEHLDMVFGARHGQKTIAIIAIHLVILWNIDKNKAIEQASSTKLDSSLIKNVATLDTTKIDGLRGRHKMVAIDIQTVLLFHYKYIGKTLTELYSGNVIFSIEESIYNNLSLTLGNTSIIEEDEDTVEFTTLMNQIQMMGN